MKKFLTALTACAVLALAMCSLSLAYDNTNADWGVKIDIQKDGSVNISYDAEKVNGTKDGWNADRKSTRLNSSHDRQSRMPSSA